MMKMKPKYTKEPVDPSILDKDPTVEDILGKPVSFEDWKEAYRKKVAPANTMKIADYVLPDAYKKYLQAFYKKFDAKKDLGTSFSSGLKLRKRDKKFTTGQSSLFIQ